MRGLANVSQTRSRAANTAPILYQISLMRKLTGCHPDAKFHFACCSIAQGGVEKIKNSLEQTISLVEMSGLANVSQTRSRAADADPHLISNKFDA